MRYYSGYWNINPSEYIQNIQFPIHFVVFDDYIHTSQNNKQTIIGLEKNTNYQIIRLSGDMFSKFSIEELKRKPLP